MTYHYAFKKYQKAKMKSHFELKRTALQRPATTTRPRRMDTKESWTPSRYLEGWRKYWLDLKPFESCTTHVFATWTPRSKAVPRTRSIWFQRLRSQSSEDLLVLHYTHHIRRSNWSNYFMTGALSWQRIGQNLEEAFMYSPWNYSLCGCRHVPSTVKE